MSLFPHAFRQVIEHAMAKQQRKRHSASKPAASHVCVIVGLTGGHITDNVESGSDQSVTLKLVGTDLQLTPQHVVSDDGIEWYSALIAASDVDRIVPNVQAHPRVASAYVQPPEGAPS